MQTCYFLLFFAALLNAQTPSTPLDGDIVNSVTGAPVPSARVKLVAGNGEPRYMSADPAGHFHFDNVPGTTYSVTVDHPSYLSSNAIHVVPGKSSVRIELTPAAILYGEVTDPNGLPARTAGADIVAEIFAERPLDPQSRSALLLPDGKHQLVNVSRSMPDDLGRFRSDPLPPGTYYVVAHASRSPWYWARTWRSTFYPHSLNLDSAKAIRLSAGQQVRADIQVIDQAGLKVTGKVTVPSYETPAGMRVFTNVHVVASSGPLQASGASTSLDQGRFEAKDLMPGKYIVTALTSQMSADQTNPETKYLFAITREVELGERDLTDVDLQLQPLPKITGTVSFGEGCTAAPVPIQLTSGSLMGVWQYSTISAADGTFTFGTYPPGSVTISAGDRGKASVLLGDHEIPQGRLDYPMPSPEPLRIVILCTTGAAR
jgi:hypothetical protein